MPGSLDGNSQSALMSSTRAGLATGLDLAALREESAQSGYVFVVNGLCLLQAEGAYSAPGCESPSALPSLSGRSLASVISFIVTHC
jgi:hypothetical protein